MSKKTITRTTKPLSPRPAVKQVDTAYLVREELDDQQERLKRATAAGAGALKTPAPAAAGEQLPTAAAPSKPLTPLAALWPGSIPPQGESKPSHAPASQAQKAPVAASSSKPSPAAAPPSPKPTALKRVPVRFVLFKPNAKRVSLCGEFNGWSPGATAMKRRDDGQWETTVALVPGRHEYKFIVDGEWVHDPAAQKNVPNEHGSLNSVLELRT